MIADVLWRNQGQVLTPELIVGILHGVSFAPDNAIANQNFPTETYRDVTFGVDRISDIEHEIAPLHRAHWEESESFRHGLPFKMDYLAYRSAEREGRFMVFTVRDQTGALKGYCQVYIVTSTHTGVRLCNEDALYLHPDVRKGRTCVEFAKYSENVVRQLGVREIRLSVKVTNDIWKLWERIGYQRTGYELVKVLEG